MIVAGIMSGTSADGIDVALVRLLGRGVNTRLHLLAHEHRNYPAAVRQAVLYAMNASSACVADLARLNTLLGELYADALEHTLNKHRGYDLELIGCHGQTLYHQGSAETFLGHKIATTWQTGESAAIAARLGIPVISDFRPADMAAGGKGAPLVPLLDYVFYRHPRRTRVLQNLGGIANFSIVPAGAGSEDVVAFDTGPGNMLIDACMQALFGKPYDHNGKLAGQGTPIASALQRALAHPFFGRKPPKTAGREEFGAEFLTSFLRWCSKKARKQDVIATATALTARSIGIALGASLKQQSFWKAATKPKKNTHDYVVSGGGARNKTLLKMLRMEVAPLGFDLRTSDEFGLPAEAKEAAAFALLAYQTWQNEPGNLPSATGASRPAILGKVTYV
jgi:anhydro-N-acetylmuramic acid kinase